jgi:hypothetical protein
MNKYTHKTYGMAKIMLREGWYTEDDVKNLLICFEQMRKAAKASMREIEPTEKETKV